MWDRIGEALVGVPFPVSFAAALADTPEAIAFADAYKAKYNSVPDNYASQGYMAIHYIAQGLKSLTGKPDRESLAQAMAAITEIEPNVYGGLPMKDGQADVQEALIANWTKEGVIGPWEGN